MTMEELEAIVCEIRDSVRNIEKRLATLTVKQAAAQSPKGEIADDADLDGQYGDETIRKDPSAKYWEGESFAGCNLSGCSPEYLDAYARYKDACAYMNQKSGDESKAKYIDYDRKSARRARGWAKRLRGGWKPAVAPVQTEAFVADGQDDIPF